MGRQISRETGRFTVEFFEGIGQFFQADTVGLEHGDGIVVRLQFDIARVFQIKYQWRNAGDQS